MEELMNQTMSDSLSPEVLPEGNRGQQEQTSDADKSIAAAFELNDQGKIKFQGQEWTAKELEKAILRQKDYTQKTQTLAEERKAFLEEKKFSDNLAADLRTIVRSQGQNQQMLINEFIKIYPQKYHAALRHELDSLTGSSQPQNQQQRPNTPDIELLGRLTTLEKFYQSQEEAKHSSWLDSQMTKMSSKYPDAVPEMVLGRLIEIQSAMSQSDPNARITEREVEDVFKAVDQAINQKVKSRYGELQKQQQQANAKAKGPGPGGAAVGRAPQKFTSLKDVTAHAIRDLSGRS